MARLVNMARAAAAEAIKPGPDPAEAKPPAEPTAADEGKQVLHHINRDFGPQLIPFKTAAAAVLAGVYEQSQGPHLGALLLVPALAYAAWVITNFKLGWRPLGKGRFEYTQPAGRRATRVHTRSWRAAYCFALIGVWLNLLALTGPVRLLNLPVWLVGAVVWAVISDECWWRPARLAADRRPVIHAPAVATYPEQTGLDDDEQDTREIPVPVHRTRRAGPAAASPGARPGRPEAAAPAEPVAVLPPLDVFHRAPLGVDPVVEDLSTAIQQVINDHPTINAKVLPDPLRAPRTTRYAIQPAPGQDPKALAKLVKAFEYACKGPVTIYDPIPGTGLFGVEVGHAEPVLVTLRELLTSPFARADHHPLLVAIGKDNEGQPVLVNLASLPHLLIAGTTGGGKSICLHCLINSLLARAKPEQVRLLLIDPKKVELTDYEGIPHLLFPVVTDANRAVNALEWLCDEMDDRYDLFKKHGVRNIVAYNRKLAEGHIAGKPLHYIVCIIDELSDLMMAAPKEVEKFIVRITQLARAAGIHLVVATQQPIVKVVTGLIKANMPSRLAFAVATQSDSRVILDQNGAELLLGKGDSLFKPQDRNRPLRVQGAWITEQDIHTVIAHWRAQPRDGVVMPAIDLDRLRDDTQTDDGDGDVTVLDDAPNGRTPARKTVLAAMERHADENGEITKDWVVMVTPGIGEANRNLAIGQLRELKLIEDVGRVGSGHYRVLTLTKPTPTEES